MAQEKGLGKIVGVGIWGGPGNITKKIPSAWDFQNSSLTIELSNSELAACVHALCKQKLLVVLGRGCSYLQPVFL